MYCSFSKFFFDHYKQTSTTFTVDQSLHVKCMYLQRFLLIAQPIIYFFFVDARVEGRDDCWDGVRGGWGEWGCAVDAWEGARFDMLVLTGLCAGVWDSPALARDADRSRARIFSRACFSSVSAWMTLSSAVCALSSVSLKLEKKTSY